MTMVGITEALAAAILQEYGPFAAVALLLWFRVNRLESKVDDRLRDLRSDISENRMDIARTQAGSGHPLDEREDLETMLDRLEAGD